MLEVDHFEIGPSFTAELTAAGLLGLPFSWTEYEIVFGEEMTEEQRSAVESVLASHDPSLPAPAPVPESVSARQFKLQLLAENLLDQVEAWVAEQSRAVQIAFEYSGSFVKSEPMMQAGFAALGFSTEQIDAFFAAAAEL
ncbi:hypothetical protein U8Q06_20910 [Rhizobium beringeri]|uniref:hypothetical protein n=1 Tax=Rhizobium beringeri TaxID=3019934 RepID=UPI002E125356|nr:hypothetical protein U8Q06_20910 [Rhizobium beringeri]